MTRKPGRPSKPIDTKLTQVSCRFNAAQCAYLEQVSQLFGFSVSAYVQALVEADRLRTGDKVSGALQEVKNLRDQIGQLP